MFVPYGKAPPERDTLFRPQVYERVGKSFIAAFESRPERAFYRAHFIAVKKTRNFSGLVIYSHLRDISAVRAVKRDADFLTSM